MQHNLIHHLRCIHRIPFAPIIAHTVRKYIPRPIKVRGCDSAAHFGVAFESVFCVLVPEMEGAVASSGAEGSVLRVEGNGVDGVDVCVVLGGAVAVAFEGEVGAERVVGVG